MNTPLVSILIPCYNGARFVIRCLDSVLAQTYPRIEVILIDDGSTDASKEEIERYISAFSARGYDLRYYYQPNAGSGAAINFAIKHFTGEYLFLLDIDDFLTPTIISVCAHTLIEHPDYDLVRVNGYTVLDSDIEKRLNKYAENARSIAINSQEKIFQGLIDGNVYNWAGSYMIRSRAFLKQYPTRQIYVTRSGQHLQMLLPVTYFGKSYFINEPLARYCRGIASSHSVSASGGFFGRLEMLKGYQEIRENVVKMMNISDQEKERWLKRIENNYAVIRAKTARAYGEPKAFWHEVRTLIKRKAFTPRVMFNLIRK